jgi:single-stranded DNA-specific DHH superfamily exonuclease
MAAGLTIKKSAFDTFRRTLLVRAANLRLSPPTYNIDAEVDTVDQDLIQKVNALEPFGKGFEPPLFLIKRDATGGKKVGSNHLKIIDNGIEYVVWDAYENAKNKNIAIIGRPSLSDYNGGTQFIAKDYRLA